MALVTMSRKELGRLEALVDLDAGRMRGRAGRRADRGRRAPGVPAAEGVPGWRRRRPRLAAARPAEQPAPPRRGARGRARRRPRALRRLRPDARGREAGRASTTSRLGPRDAAALDDRRRASGSPRKDARARVHQPRHRRDCLGELVQIDGCEHRWFEDRGPPCTLLVFVDDATSRLMHLRFVTCEIDLRLLPARHEPTSRRTASRSPSTPTSTPCSGSTNGATRRRRHDPVRPGAGGAERRPDLRQQPAGQGPGRAGAQDLAGPAGEGAAAGRGQHDRGGNAFLPAFVADYNARFAKEPRLRQGPAPAGAGRSGPRRVHDLARGAHGLGQPDPALRQAAVPAGADRGHPAASPGGG